MNLRNLGTAVLASEFALVGFAPASATTVQLERSGNTYHMAVCAKAVSPGVARCFAHVVTDARGNIRNGKLSLAPNAVPSGYGPSDLRSAYSITTTGSATTTIAIVDAYGYTNAERDLGVYRSQYG